MGVNFLVLCILVFLCILCVLQFYFIFVPCSVALFFASICRLFVSGICDFPLGDHNVVSGYLLFPWKSVLYLASWCVDLSDADDFYFLSVICWRFVF